MLLFRKFKHRIVKKNKRFLAISETQLEGIESALNNLFDDYMKRRNFPDKNGEAFFLLDEYYDEYYKAREICRNLRKSMEQNQTTKTI